MGAWAASETVQSLIFSAGAWVVRRGYLLLGAVIPLLIFGVTHSGASRVSLLHNAQSICAGRGGDGAPGGEVTVVGDALPAC